MPAFSADETVVEELRIALARTGRGVGLGWLLHRHWSKLSVHRRWRRAGSSRVEQRRPQGLGAR